MMKFVYLAISLVFIYLSISFAYTEETDRADVCAEGAQAISETGVDMKEVGAFIEECMGWNDSIENIKKITQENKINKIRENSLIALPDDFDFSFPLTDEEYYDKIFTLDWKTPESELIRHNSANAYIATIETDSYYLDNKIDILQYFYWNEGILFDVNNFEVYQELDFGTLSYTTFNNDGYVRVSDWDDVNENEFIEEKRDLIFAANATREELDRDTVVRVDWLAVPELDKTNNIVHYAFELEWDSGHISRQSTSLILGRNGYTEVTSLLSDDYKFDEAYAIIKNALSKYNFAQDYQYKDYKSGDKVAAVGIASLLAASFGIKGLAKSGGFLVLLKKFWWVIFAPLIFLGRLVNRNK